MAYDAYGRSQQGDGEPGYFDTNDSKVPEYSNQYTAEPRDKPSLRRRTSSNARTSPPINEKMARIPENARGTGYDDVSPELIAAIAEKVKKEVVEHLKQTGTVDDQPKAQPKAQPMQRAPSNKSSSSSSPPPTARRVYTPPSPTQPPKPTYTGAPSPMESVRSPPSSPSDKPSGVRFSDRSLPARPLAPRTYSTTELSTIDQKWGRLFDSKGNPTQRLGQFLRGLANHIIDDFPPKKSIVVTPSKMAAYYTSHSLEKETHSLTSIFRPQSNEEISRLYQDLGCQHHLVQEHSSTAPAVPALTPVGFAQWMTIYILAYPEEESRRLEKVVLAMPIDADGEMVDGKPERLPKQISRHLLPDREDRKSRKLLDNAIHDFLDDLGKQSRRKTSITSPSLSRHSSTSQSRSRLVEIHQEKKMSPTTAKAQPIERERNPYAGAPSASESSSNEESINIERERQPYTAKEGSGKVYTESVNLEIPTKLSRANSTSRTRDQPDETRHHRTQSTASTSHINKPRTSGRRTSSPPFKSFSHSTPDDIHAGSKYGPGPSSTSSSFTSPPSQTFSPSSVGSTASFPPPPPPVDIRDPRDTHRRSRDDRSYRRGMEDETRPNPELNSPREAEKWDAFQESQSQRTDRPYERGSVAIDPLPRERGAAYEDWYREKGRGSAYDAYNRY